MFVPVASDPTVSRLIGSLAAAGPKALSAIRAARAETREAVWNVAKSAAPDAVEQVIVDLDGVLVLAHSEKQDATGTWKKSFGHHPLMGFVDHGASGSGEPVAGLLSPGNAGSNTAADHITTARLALAQLPKKYRRGRQTLIRTDSGGGTHKFPSPHSNCGTASEPKPRTASGPPAPPKPAQPAPARHRQEPDLAGDRPARPRLPRMDAHARSERQNPRVGAPPPPAPPLLRRRPDRHHRPPPAREIARHWPWTDVITDAIARLEALPNPG